MALADITDGSAQTLLAGERSFALGDATWVGAVTGTMTYGHGSVGRPTAPEPAASAVLAYTGNVVGPGDPRGEFSQFYCLHGRGANFAFADGHVTFLSSTLDIRVFRALATRAGGEALGEGY